MTDMQHVVQVVSQPNPAILRVKPSPDASQIMGQFRPARYDRLHHAYDMPADLAGAFETFCRLHGLLLLDTRPTPIGAVMPTNSADVLAILDEQRQRLHDPEQDERNRRGIEMCRLAMRLAIIKREHRAR